MWWTPITPEEQAARRARLAADLKRNSFADILALRANGGKTEPPQLGIVPNAAAHAFLPPGFKLVSRDGAPAELPDAASNVVGVVLVEGAKEALASWGASASAAATTTTLSLVTSPLLSLPPLRWLVLRGAGRPAWVAPASSFELWHFGRAEALRSLHRMDNALVPYVFLLDGAGRVRWRARGTATPDETTALARCCDALAEEMVA